MKVNFHGALATSVLVCRQGDGSADLTEYEKRMYWALIMMKRLRFSRPLPWTEKTLYEWFASTVSLVEVFTSTANSYADLSRRWIYIMVPPSEGVPTYPEFRWYAVARLISGLVHEARHIDFGPHTCGQTRDRTVAEMGADGAQNSFFTWLAEYSEPSVVPPEYAPVELWLACEQRKKLCDEPKTVTCR